MKKIVAITTDGREYMYTRRSAHAVPAPHADLICSALNRSGYKLQTGEKWKVYSVDLYAFQSCSAPFQRFSIRNNRLMETA